MGRTARGVRSINLKKDGDAVVGMVILRDDLPHILSISTQGYGKRTTHEEYRKQGRGGSGIINFKLSDKTGVVAAVVGVGDRDELMVITDGGVMIRTEIDQISIMGRSTQGVKIINVTDDSAVASVARIAEPEEDEPETGINIPEEAASDDNPDQ